MKKSNQLSEKEIKELREQFKQKHNRSIFFNDGSIFSQIRDFFHFKGCIPML
jgi:hypothetical protein